MENNENTNVEKNSCKCGFAKILSIIAIVLSIISISISAFMVGSMCSHGNDHDDDRRHSRREERMECPMKDQYGCGMTRRNGGCPSISGYEPQFDRPSFESNGPSSRNFWDRFNQNNNNSNKRQDDNKPNDNKPTDNKPNPSY